MTVRVALRGHLRSDLKLLPWKLPVTMGHEFAGVLDDGTVVAVQPNAPVRRVRAVRRRPRAPVPESNHRIHGVFSDGGLADEVIVDRSSLVMLAPGVAPDVGALIEPISVRCTRPHQGGLHGDAAA